jgi:hypothetical protein
MPSAPTYANEFYVVGPTVDVVAKLKATGESARIRIELLKDPNGVYSVKSYIEEHITVQPTYPKEHGEFTSRPKDVLMWVDYDLPWVSQKSADVALAQALNFLSERCVE